MRAIYYFIVEVLDDYNNYEVLDNGLKVIVNTSRDSVEHINRIGKIVSSPKGTKAEEGDMVLFHHNICRKAYGFKGKKELSPFQIKPDHYYIPATEIFMVDKGNGWEAIDPFVFVEPLPPEMVTLENGLQMTETDYKGQDEFVGTIAFSNPYLREKGIKEGDMVSFQEYSQHEYEINGKLYYKMQTNDILAVME